MRDNPAGQGGELTPIVILRVEADRAEGETLAAAGLTEPGTGL
jgi:hypothetical protein